MVSFWGIGLGLWRDVNENGLVYMVETVLFKMMMLCGRTYLSGWLLLICVSKIE